MKISNLETAMKLAKITGRPLEDFYEAPQVCIEEIDNKQEIEESMERETTQCEEQITVDISEIECDQEIESTVCRVSIQLPEGELATTTQKYRGEISKGGKIINNKIDMSRKEYLLLTKNMTQKDILNSPLLYLFFRAEGQVEGHFYNWLESFPAGV